MHCYKQSSNQSISSSFLEFFLPGHGKQFHTANTETYPLLLLNMIVTTTIYFKLEL
jgi:hypothetical protein